MISPIVALLRIPNTLNKSNNANVSTTITNSVIAIVPIQPIRFPFQNKYAKKVVRVPYTSVYVLKIVGDGEEEASGT